MKNVHNGPWRGKNFSNTSSGDGSPIDSGGGPPDDPRMLERIEKLEKLVERTVERVVNIERDVAVMRSNYATKEDIKGITADFHRELHATTWKIIGALALICASVFWIARNVESPAHPAPAPAAAASTK